MKRFIPNPLVTRAKKPRRLISPEKYDEFSVEELWTCYKHEEGLTFKTFMKNLPDIRKYLKQVRVSEGFDIDVVPKVCIHVGAVLPDDCCPERWPEKYEAFMNLAKLALGFYNIDNRKKFVWYEVDKVEKVNSKIGCLYDLHFLTFTAVNVGKRGCRGDPVTFQALVIVKGMLMFNKDGEKRIELCRLKPEAPVEHDDGPSCISVLKEGETIPDAVPFPESD